MVKFLALVVIAAISAQSDAQHTAEAFLTEALIISPASQVANQPGNQRLPGLLPLFIVGDPLVVYFRLASPYERSAIIRML